jgi:hypothetical protein
MELGHAASKPAKAAASPDHKSKDKGACRCQCGTYNNVANTHCELCDNLLLSPPNVMGECFRVGQTVCFARLNTELPEKGVVVRFMKSKKTGELLAQLKYADRAYSADVYDEVHPVDRIAFHEAPRTPKSGRVFSPEAAPQEVADKVTKVSASSVDDLAVQVENKFQNMSKLEEVLSPKNVEVGQVVSGKKQKTKSKNKEDARRDALDNRDLCALCGNGGEIICCDYCPCAFHSRCVSVAFPAAKAPDTDNEGEWWRCPLCTENLHNFCLSDIDLESRDPYKYMNLFAVIKKNGGRSESPAVSFGTFLHYAEIVITDPNVTLKLAQGVASIMEKALASSVQDIILLQMPIFPQPQIDSIKATAGGVLSAQHVLEVMQKALGLQYLKQLMEECLSGGHLLGAGMKPSITDAKLVCKCGKSRLFRTFCYGCGILLRINPGLYNYPLIGSDDDRATSKVSRDDCEGAAIRGKRRPYFSKKKC